MQHEEIVTQLSKIADNPAEVINAVTMKDILCQIALRFGEDALNLSENDLQLAREEVKEAINHNLDIREYIDMGIDAWEITRRL